MKHVDVKSSTYIDFGIENILKNYKFETDDHIKMQNLKFV